MKHWWFWPAFALTLPQALWVRKTAQRFEDAPGSVEGVLDGPDRLRLCGIGDSIIAGVGCRSLDQALIGHSARALHQRTGRGVVWQALGRTGATSRGIRHRLVPQLPDAPVDLFLVSAGVNDITGLKTLAIWRANLLELLTALNQHSPQARIALLGIPPMHCFPALPQPLRAVFGLRSRSFDQTARSLAATLRQVDYIPFEGTIRREQFSPDGYHPSEDSCGEIAESVLDAVAGLARR